MARLLGRTIIPLSHLGNYHCLYYDYMANVFGYNYVKVPNSQSGKCAQQQQRSKKRLVVILYPSCGLYM